MSYGSWKPYVSVAQRRMKAEKAAAKAVKSGAQLAPIAAYRGAITKTFWGKAWCDNLEHYSDYANRLPRGRTYVRNGSVIDLQLVRGEVRAQVMGSSLYRVEISVTALPETRWRAIVADCAGSIDSLVDLLQGRLSEAVMARISQPGNGLFPAPSEITLRCSCPDWADMCKHVAAVLYGVGARLDNQPELLFGLRSVDAGALVAQAGAGQAPSQAPVARRCGAGRCVRARNDRGRRASAKLQSASRRGEETGGEVPHNAGKRRQAKSRSAQIACRQEACHQENCRQEGVSLQAKDQALSIRPADELTGGHALPARPQRAQTRCNQ